MNNLRQNKPLPLPDNLIIFGRPFRLRYVAFVLFTICFVMTIISIFSSSTKQNQGFSDHIIEAGKVYEVSSEITSLESAFDREKRVVSGTQSEIETSIGEPLGIQETIIPNNENSKFKVIALPRPKPSEVRKTVRLKSGDTLGEFFVRHGLSNSVSYAITQAFTKVYDPREVKAGERFSFDLVRDEGTQELKLISLEYKPSIIETVMILPDADGGYKAHKTTKELVTKQQAAFVKIESSLYGSAAKAGLPDPVIMDIIYLYSWKLDFERDIRSGDEIRVLYEAEYTEDGDATNKYHILSASMMSKNEEIDIYRYKTKDGLTDFFLPNAKSVRQGLLRTPIEFGRVSSGYGMRRHPVLGYNKLHKGVDFAAPRGTKIFAAADGVIDKRYYSTSYGNYIRIRHTGGIQTAYAHLKGFAKKATNGARVKQGQVIGYVGSTGRSTGPHLHYEVIKNGKQVNPKSVNLPTQHELKGQEKKAFLTKLKSYNNKYKALMAEKEDVAHYSN